MATSALAQHTADPVKQAIPCAVGVQGFPPTALPAPLPAPSPARLGGGGSSPRSITAGEAHGFCPGSTARTAPQPWSSGVTPQHTEPPQPGLTNLFS